MLTDTEHPGVSDGSRLFGAPIPIAGMATFGQALRYPGLVKNTYGTGSFLHMNPGEKPAAGAQGF